MVEIFNWGFHAKIWREGFFWMLPAYEPTVLVWDALFGESFTMANIEDMFWGRFKTLCIYEIVFGIKKE